MSTPRVRIYLDDDPEPIVSDTLPADIALDTRTMTDGPHRLTVHAQDQSGAEGVEEIRFYVRNGPGIVISGLRPNSTRSGIVHLGVDAFSADDPFDPRRAEARSSIPTWVFVMSLFIVAWAVWYAASMWQVPDAMQGTPTYGSTYEQAEAAPDDESAPPAATAPSAETDAPQG